MGERINWREWKKVKEAIGNFHREYWQQPGGRMEIIQLGSLFRLLSPVRIPGMHVQCDDEDKPLFSLDFVRLDDAIKFAES